MVIECPNCQEAREQSAHASEGWLHVSMDYPELLHCNCCGSYYRRVAGALTWIPRASLSAWSGVNQSGTKP
jgi:hypothetical protein